MLYVMLYPQLVAFIYLMLMGVKLYQTFTSWMVTAWNQPYMVLIGDLMVYNGGYDQFSSIFVMSRLTRQNRMS